MKGMNAPLQTFHYEHLIILNASKVNTPPFVLQIPKPLSSVSPIPLMFEQTKHRTSHRRRRKLITAKKKETFDFEVYVCHMVLEPPPSRVKTGTSHLTFILCLFFDFR